MPSSSSHSKGVLFSVRRWSLLYIAFLLFPPPAAFRKLRRSIPHPPSASTTACVYYSCSEKTEYEGAVFPFKHPSYRSEGEMGPHVPLLLPFRPMFDACKRIRELVIGHPIAFLQRLPLPYIDPHRPFKKSPPHYPFKGAHTRLKAPPDLLFTAHHLRSSAGPPSRWTGRWT